MMPIVAIVGRPNVGKSTLFNRLIGQRKALVFDEPGVTRDRNYGVADWENRKFHVIDTGGFDPDSEVGMLPMMREQAQLAVEEANAIIFVVDVREGLTPIDEQVFNMIRTAETPVFVAVNKVDAKSVDEHVPEFYGLGIDALYAISSEHARGVDDLMEAVVGALPPEAEDEYDGLRTRIAVVGRPNAGKSTIINRVLGQNRLITSDVPGTTRDSIDTHWEVGEKKYTLIDTVGIRRKRSVSWAVERFGVIKAIQAIERAHVVVLMVDATGGMADQDAKIASLAVERGRALIIVLNKWDAVEKTHRTADQMIRDIRERFKSMDWAPIITMSALTGLRSNKLLERIDAVHEAWNLRITTSDCNKWFADTTRRRPPPLYKKRSVKLYYATQARSRPPTFVLQSNMPSSAFPEAYRRYLVNQLRMTFAFEGTPLKLVVRQRTSRFNDGDPE